jgi:phosphoenolpyruvate-protein phosphotransferase
VADARDTDSLMELVAPLDGWVLPLAEVPDPVFAAAMAGDGVAIDPTGESLHAPCDGVVVLMGGARHALTLRSRAGDILLHVGIDTVRLAGAGFQRRVRDGETVRAGQVLVGFDLDAIVRGAPSAITPVLLTGARAGRITRRLSNRRVSVGDFLLAVEIPPAAARSGALAQAGALVGCFRIPFEHGLHARPAARVAAALVTLDAQVELRARGREANARSTVALMSLGVDRGEIVTASASGRDAAAALAALAGLLEPVAEPARAQVQPAPMPAPVVPLAAPAAGARVAGIVAARGLAVGVAAPQIGTDPPVGPALGDAAAEGARLEAAIGAVAAFIRELAAAGAGAHRGVLEAHLALLADPQLLGEAKAQLLRGASAGAAWRSALRDAAAALAALEDPLMAERRADLLDIERQVLRVLTGAPANFGVALPRRAIVLAAELLPSQLLALDATRLAGLCMAEGGATSHVAILAAAMGLPTLVAAGAAVQAIAAGTPLVLDAEQGFLLVDPSATERQRVEALVAARAQAHARDAAAAQLPATLRDGTAVHVYCNLGAAAETAPAVAAGAEGCGLLRTEFLFLGREHAPDEAEQLAEYQAIASALGGRTLTIRTLDAGGDKPIAYLPQPREGNPALGLRGLRTSLAYPELLASQLRAIVQVTPPGQCRVLLPMVTEVGEVRGVRAQLAAIAAECGVAPPALGIMIETPASALLAEQLCAQVDFLSIGSNDLSQYTLAMDRLHPTLASRLDAVHPAVLRLIQRAAAAGGARGLEVGVCGGLASDPAAVPLLIGFGVRELSVVPAQIPRIKSLVRTLNVAECAALAQRALELESAAAVRTLVHEWSEHNA